MISGNQILDHELSEMPGDKFLGKTVSLEEFRSTIEEMVVRK
jgi:hypothetical protein